MHTRYFLIFWVSSIQIGCSMHEVYAECMNYNYRITENIHHHTKWFTTCDAAHQKGDFEVKSIWAFYLMHKSLFLSFKMTPHLSKLDQSIHILQLKKDQKFLLFSSLFSECFHLYVRKSTAANPLFTCTLECAKYNGISKFNIMYLYFLVWLCIVLILNNLEK